MSDSNFNPLPTLKNGTLSEARFAEVWRLTGGSETRTARIIKCSRGSARIWARALGLTAAKPGPTRADVTPDRFAEVWRKHGGKAGSVAGALGISITCALRMARRAGFAVRKRGRPREEGANV